MLDTQKHSVIEKKMKTHQKHNKLPQLMVWPTNFTIIIFVRFYKIYIWKERKEKKCEFGDAKLWSISDSICI